VIALGAFAAGIDSPLPREFYLAPINWAVESVCTIASHPFQSDHRGTLEKRVHRGGSAAEPVEVLHIVASSSASITVVMDAVVKHGIPLVRSSLTGGLGWVRLGGGMLEDAHAATHLAGTAYS
jgi:hypothetical protein